MTFSAVSGICHAFFVSDQPAGKHIDIYEEEEQNAYTDFKKKYHKGKIHHNGTGSGGSGCSAANLPFHWDSIRHREHAGGCFSAYVSACADSWLDGRTNRRPRYWGH